MSRLALVPLVVALTACASAPVKQVATAPSPTTASCPLFVVDGVVQSSTCGSRTKTDSSDRKKALVKCDPAAPLYVVDGFVVGDCAKP